MDARAEVREFLTSRRARILPAQVGLTPYGARQVPGLRREEVATLAGVSVDYYNRMERGNLGGVSEGVLAAIARALLLDEAEHEHLVDLARAVRDQAEGRRPPPPKRSVRPGISWLIDAMTGSAAFVVNSRQDILAANHLGRSFFEPLFRTRETPNMARFTYLDPVAETFFSDWNRTAKECVAALRTQVGRSPLDRGLSELVGELSTRSTTFATLWAGHDVRLHRNQDKSFDHPVVGDLTLRYEQLSVAGESGLEIFAYTAEPGSVSAERFALLGHWVTETPSPDPLQF